MIIGHGDLASVLTDREGAIFFASGVSNSQCQDYGEFHREIDLLRKFKGDVRCLFYFSTINSSQRLRPYFIHKWDMEERVKHWFENYCIIKLGNINWGKNPNTFINYLRAHPEAEIRDEWKYMISKEQLLLLTNNLPLVGKHEISVFGEMKKVKDCL